MLIQVYNTSVSLHICVAVLMSHQQEKNKLRQLSTLSLLTTEMLEMLVIHRLSNGIWMCPSIKGDHAHV